MTLADQVRRLEERHYETMTLLGSICTTLTLPRNVEMLEKEEGGKRVVDMARGWLEHFRQLEKAP